MVWPVQILIWGLYVVAYPISRLLDWMLGEHSGIVYRRGELKQLIQLHGEGHMGGDLEKDTITIISGTLDIQIKMVRDAMTPMQKVFQLSLDSKLDYQTLGRGQSNDLRLVHTLC